MGSFKDRVINDPLFMHEYGHTFDSQIFGPFYLRVVGLPSLISAATSRPLPGGIRLIVSGGMNEMLTSTLQDTSGSTTGLIGVFMSPHEEDTQEDDLNPITK